MTEETTTEEKIEKIEEIEGSKEQEEENEHLICKPKINSLKLTFL